MGKGFFGRKKILFLGIITVAVMYVLFNSFGPMKGEQYDVQVVSFVSISLMVASLTMLIATWNWTLRSTGVLFVVLGLALLNGAAVVLYFYGDHISPLSVERTTDVARSMLIVGAPTLLVGNLVWVYRWLRCPVPLGEDDI